MNLQTNKIIEAARELLKACGYFTDSLWHVDDIHFICEQHGDPPLTYAEAMEVFRIAHQQFDGETGISWPQLGKAVQTYLQRKQILAGMCGQTACDSAS